MSRFCFTGATFDSGSMLMDAGEANLCSFDSTLTFFDSSARTFDQTTCQEVPPSTPPVEEHGGGGGDRRPRRRKNLTHAFKPVVPNRFYGSPKPPVETMSQFEIHQEMATLLHRKLRKDEEARAVLLLLAMLA